MAKPTVIGRVSVKVWPDTRTFRRDAKEQLKKKAAGLKAKVQLEPATDHFKAQANRKIREVQAMLNDLVVDMKVDAKEMRRRVDEAMRDLKWQLDPFIDERKVRAEMRRVEALMERKVELEILLETELDEWHRRKVERQLEELTDQIEVAIAPNVSDPFYYNAVRRLAWLSRTRIVELVPRVSKTAAAKAAATLAALSGLRVANKYLDDFVDTLSRLDKNVPKITLLSLALLNLTGYLAAAASNTFAFGQSLAQMFQASLALPGILGGIAIGIGATIAVLKDFNTVLPHVKDDLSELQDLMSEQFWQRAKKPFEDLYQVIFPQFASGVRATSDALGVFFAELFTSLRRHLDGALIPMFDNLNESIAVASTGTEAYAGIIEKLGTVGSQYLPRLAGWFVRLSRRFDDFLRRNTENGQIFEWIEHGIHELREFGRILANTGRILRNLARAAERAGGSTFTTMADTLERVARVTGKPSFQRNLTGVLEASHRAMTNIAESSGKQFYLFVERLSELLQVTLPVAGRAAGAALGGIFDALSRPAVQEGVYQMFTGIEKGINGILPSLPKVGDAFGALLEIIGKLAENLGPVLGAGFEVVADVILRLKQPVKDLIDDLGPGLKRVIEELAPVALALAEALADLIDSTKGWRGDLLNGIADLLAVITPAAVYLIEDLARALEDLSSILNGKSPGSNGETGGIVGYLVAFVAIAGTVAWAVGKIKSAFNGAKGVLKLFGIGAKDAGDKARGAGGKVGDLGDKAKGSSGKIGGLTSKLGKLGKGLLGLPGLALLAAEGLRDLGKAILPDDLDFISDGGLQTFLAGFGKLKEAIRNESPSVRSEFMESMRSAVEGAGVPLDEARGTLWGRAANMMQGVIDGVGSARQGIDASARNSVAGVPDAIGSPQALAAAKAAELIGVVSTTFVGGYTPFWQAVATAVSGVPDAVGSPQAQAAAKASEIVGTIRDTFFGGKTPFWTAMTGAVSGIPGAVSTPNAQARASAQRVVESVRSTFFAGKTPFWQAARDAVSNVPKGVGTAQAGARNEAQRIVNAAVRAIGNGQSAAHSSAAAVGRAAQNGMSAGGAGSYNVGVGIAQGLANGIRGGIGWVTSAARSIASSAVSAAKWVLSINSPSRVFRNIGYGVSEGFVQGMDRSARSVTQSVHNNFGNLREVGQFAVSSLAEGMESKFSEVSRTLGQLDNLVSTDLTAKISADIDPSRHTREINKALSGEGVVVKQFNYYAAEGPSLSAEEQLFEAAARGRMVF